MTFRCRLKCSEGEEERKLGGVVHLDSEDGSPAFKSSSAICMRIASHPSIPAWCWGLLAVTEDNTEACWEHSWADTSQVCVTWHHQLGKVNFCSHLRKYGLGPRTSKLPPKKLCFGGTIVPGQGEAEGRGGAGWTEGKVSRNQVWKRGGGRSLRSFSGDLCYCRIPWGCKTSQSPGRNFRH